MGYDVIVYVSAAIFLRVSGWAESEIVFAAWIIAKGAVV